MAGELTTLIPAARDTVNRATYSMGSATYTSGRVYIIAVRNRRTAGAVDSPSISGGLISWSKAHVNFLISAEEHVTVFVGICSTTETATLSITFPNNQANCSWHVAEGTGLSTVSIANLVVQAKTGTSTSTTPSFTFDGAFAAADNLTYAFASYAAIGSAENIDAEASMTELDQIESSGFNIGYLHVSWKNSEEATVSWTKSSTDGSGHAILELRLSTTTVSVTGVAAAATAAAIEGDITAGDATVSGATAAATADAYAGSLETPSTIIEGVVAAATAEANIPTIDSGTVLGPSRIGGRPVRLSP